MPEVTQASSGPCANGDYGCEFNEGWWNLVDIREGEEVDETAFKALIRQAITCNRCTRAKPAKKAKP